MTRSLRFEDLKKAITKAGTLQGLVQRRGAVAFATGFGVLLQGFEDLVEQGRPSEALELIELTMHKIEAVWDKVDDSNGYLGEVFKDLQDLHLDACRAARPDRKKLARHLFEWAFVSDYDAFRDTPHIYADILGSTGMAELARIVDLASTKQTPGSNAWERASKARMLREWAVVLAGWNNDLDKILKVMTRDLKESRRYLEVAEACKKHGRLDLAESWAEKGVKKAFRDGVSPSLKSFLAHLYADQGKIDPAFKLLWENFEQANANYIQAYKDLKQVGEKVGFWKEWRELVLTRMRKGMGYEGKGSLVRVLIAEGLLRKAHEEASADGCTIPIWTELAGALADDGELNLAYSTFQNIFSFAMNDYDAVYGRSKVHDTICKMQGIAEQMNKVPMFLAWLEGQKTVYKRRTGFLNDLKRVGL
jgi:hypothetical protein